MIRRDYWTDRIRLAWEKAPIVWLTGVRRVGKTTLAHAVPDAHFLNCDLPSTVRLLDDPERFYASVSTRVVVFDEIHRLPDPSRILKIGADEFPHLRILATGSSTLAATQKFRDSLTGRKRDIHLLPVLAREWDAFGIRDIRRRLLHGGLPEPLLADEKDPEFFTEWLDSFYARDIEELFNVGKRQGFLRLVESLLRQSGGLLEKGNVAKHCGLSRPTVASYLDILEVTHVALPVRPYHAGGRQEFLRRPKAYGFDTGFVSHFRGWEKLREQDCGVLWEHVVLETLLAHRGHRDIFYWRDKQQREVDFVIPGAGGSCCAVECKWNADRLSVRGLKAFRGNYPEGKNCIISPQLGDAYTRNVDGLELTFCNLHQWEQLGAAHAREV
ncbi:MAG: ATP-binding protein [Candidatus Eisenbacteria bacterium]